MTEIQTTEATNEGNTKSGLIRQELAKGNTKVSDIRKALEAQDVSVSENLIHAVKQKVRAANSSEVAPGVVRVRKEGAALATTRKAVAIARPGSKKEAILALYRGGMTKASEIREALTAAGISTSTNNIYVVLADEKAASEPKAAAPKAPEPKKAAPKAPARKVEEAPVNPELLKLMQAAALQYGSGAVEQAATHVSQRSREMIKQTFRLA